MTYEQAIKERDAALRESQLDLFHSLRLCLDEASREMLGNKDWSTDKVDRELRELMDELISHFGEEE